MRVAAEAAGAVRSIAQMVERVVIAVQVLIYGAQGRGIR
jgi:hypothetical protein